MKESLITATRLVGDGNNRNENDFYSTPTYATMALLALEEFEGLILEPACGTGAISKELIRQGHIVESSDLIDRGYGVQHDFLADHIYQGINHVITNPPFKLALEFIEQSKKVADRKIAMFLKTTFLEGVKRYDMFQDKKFPLKCMYQFSKRVSFGKDEGTHKNGGMMAFAWFVWDKQYTGKPYIDWIP